MKLFIKILTITILIVSCSANKIIDKRVAYFDDLESVNYFIGKGFYASKLNSEDLFIVDEVLEKAILNDEFYFLNEKNLFELKKYYRQVLVYKDSNNDKWVYISAMCKVHSNIEWKKEMYSVTDGGPCYWNIKINLTKKEYHDIIVNGYA